MYWNLSLVCCLRFLTIDLTLIDGEDSVSVKNKQHYLYEQNEKINFIKETENIYSKRWANVQQKKYREENKS